jgi:cellulose synthase/poly-beta-1,6-N-acetylglucosamine synthase-like glycosyltransferase
MEWLGYVLYGIYVLSTLWLLVNAFVQLHLLYLSKKGKNKLQTYLPNNLQFITIQVPVYNEKFVVEELLQSLADLDYPKHLYEIQVLDDSTDETSFLLQNKAEDLKRSGIDISIIKRANRHEFKAGALQHGLKYAKGEFIAIFDADFRPAKNFLQSMMANFTADNIGLVQAHWGHLNREQNFLTRIQTYLLDMHFLVEQSGRYNADYYINFCGTAGIWRKQCIDDAGGWDGTVLSEDLYLSYRAQLKGWKIVYDKNIEVPAQLPSAVEAFKIQQFRWTKGIAQTAVKTLRTVFNQPVSFAKKLHSTFHLLGSFTFVCLFINAILTIPLLILRNRFPQFVQLTDYTAIGALNLAALGYLYYKSCAAGGNNKRHFLVNYPIFIVVYLAMSAQNSIAVLQGLFGVQSPFVRTPKFDHNSSANQYLKPKINWVTVLEISLLAYFIYGISLSIFYRDFFMMLFFMMISAGLIVLLYHSLKNVQFKNWFPFKFSMQAMYRQQT